MAPSFDLVVATVDRVEELRRFLASLDAQTYREFRVLIADQNEDDRIAALLHDEIVHLRSGRGLSRARNAALPNLEADVVAFPDDDCVYPADLLERVARRFAADPSLDGLTGRGAPSPSWAKEAATLTRDNLWNRAISYATFLRRELVERVGVFDERLGLPNASAEEIDYLIRAVDLGAHIEYDPSLVVGHDEERRDERQLARRDGRSIGYILRKHRYPPRTVGRMLVRPVGGALLAVLNNDPARARFQLSTLRGRVVGYRTS